MILQTDPRLNKQINKYGCYFMSILFIAAQRAGVLISAEYILDLYKTCIRKGFMDDNCYISNAEGIFKYLGVDCEYNNRHDSPFYHTNRNEIEILCIKYPTYKHFVVGDGCGHIAYNPMGLTDDNGYVESKRIFRL